MSIGAWIEQPIRVNHVEPKTVHRDLIMLVAMLDGVMPAIINVVSDPGALMVVRGSDSK